MDHGRKRPATVCVLAEDGWARPLQPQVLLYVEIVMRLCASVLSQESLHSNS